MNLRQRSILAQTTFMNAKFFATKDDFHIVSTIVPSPAMGDDVDGWKYRCLSSGRTFGKVIDQGSQYWDTLSAVHPPGLRVLQANLSEVSDFRRDENRVPHTASDVQFQIVDQFGNPVRQEAIYSWNSRITLPLPSRDNIIRVAGNIGLVGYLLGGSTWFARLQLLVKRYLGRDIDTLDNILDWGVGCARIGRHLLERGFRGLYGADIDQVNIDWLHENFGWKQAVRVDFDPPMPFGSDFFDVIYGHSVLTHLSEVDQFRWLAELHRVLKPGGYAFLTTSGEDGVYQTRYRDVMNNPEKIEAFLNKGFFDFEDQSYVGVDAGREGYYRLVSHTRPYVMERWSTLFSVRRILPCFMEHQDLVILRKN
jgi:SAM-dependent methyltransferase